MAFMRGDNEFNSQGSIWLRNMQTGQEQLWFRNDGTVVCYDWSLDDTALIMDYDCGIWLPVSYTHLPSNCRSLRLVAARRWLRRCHRFHHN